MKQIFIELVIPQQFAFRRRADRVYIPDYIDKICLPVFGREIFGLSDDDSENESNSGSFTIV